MRWALFLPMPGTMVSASTSSRSTRVRSSSGVKMERMASPVRGPSLEMESRVSKAARSSREENPNSSMASSRTMVRTVSARGSPLAGRFARPRVVSATS